MTSNVLRIVEVSIFTDDFFKVIIVCWKFFHKGSINEQKVIETVMANKSLLTGPYLLKEEGKACNLFLFSLILFQHLIWSDFLHDEDLIEFILEGYKI